MQQREVEYEIMEFLVKNHKKIVDDIKFNLKHSPAPDFQEFVILSLKNYFKNKLSFEQIELAFDVETEYYCYIEHLFLRKEIYYGDNEKNSLH